MIRFFIPAILWIILILVLCTLPGKDLPQVSFLDKIHFDKIVHFGLFAGIVVLICYGLYKSRQALSNLAIISVVILAGLYGLAIEFIQKYLVTSRSFDMYDVLFDTLGAIAGALVFKYWMNYQAKKA
ncbi:VanZ family protein [Chitinophaga caeni]|nr:VanZ family protein [Chitinophaga caeni]